MQGLLQFWQENDAIGRTVVVLLMAMSVSAWVLIFWKGWVLLRARRDIDRAVGAFWSADTLEAGRIRLAALDREGAVRLLQAAGIACGRISDLDDLQAHPQARHVTVDSPTGPVRMMARGVRFGDGGIGTGPVPAKDQHGAALRREFSYSLRDTGLTKLNEDIVVPRSKLVELVEFTQMLQAETGTLPSHAAGGAGPDDDDVVIGGGLAHPG